MKIYYVDGMIGEYENNKRINENIDFLKSIDFTVDARFGWSACEIKLLQAKLEERERTNGKPVTILTNSLQAFSNEYSWDDKEKRFDIYFWIPQYGWCPIQTLTNRTLKEHHNIIKMYVAGEFDW